MEVRSQTVWHSLKAAVFHETSGSIYGETDSSLSATALSYLDGGRVRDQFFWN